MLYKFGLLRDGKLLEVSDILVDADDVEGLILFDNADDLKALRDEYCESADKIVHVQVEVGAEVDGYNEEEEEPYEEDV